MNVHELKRRLEQIFELQRERMFILTGFYLPDEQLAQLQPDLQPDDPDVGAVGRYQRVPVFARSDWPDDPSDEVQKRDTHHGIHFTYVQMDVVD